MAKRWRKQKAQAQRPKLRKPKARASREGSSAGGAGGTMGALRGGFRGIFAGGSKGGKPTLLSRAFDAALWLAVAVMLYFFISNRCAG